MKKIDNNFLFKGLMLLAVAVLGISSMWAQLPYNTTLTENHYNNTGVVVTKEGTQSWEEGVRLGTNSWLRPGNWDDKFIVIALNQQSIPYQLSFKCRITTTMATQPDWYVEESSDNVNWSRVWSASAATSSIITVSTDWATPDPLTLSKSTKYVKICYTGNYSGIVADIKVTDQAYVNNPKVGDDEITSLDFGAGTISSGVAELAFDVEWCNVEALEVTSDNTQFFTVSPASFGGKAQYGTQTVKVSYDRNKEINSHEATITMTNGSVTKTVTVAGVTTKREQAIHWNADLEATSFTMNAGDELSGDALATADNEEAVLTYVSDNEDVIAVSEDGFTLYAVSNGTANITATASGNDIYAEGTDTKLFTVTADRKQVIEWDQNFMSLKTDADPNTIELTAMATSGGVVTYALEEGSDACVTLSGENNAVMTITGTPGSAYIIATQEGGEIDGEIWIAATARKLVKVRDPHAACDEYALADAQYTFPKEDKNGMVYKEFALEGKPTNLTFYAKRGQLKYTWNQQQELYIDQYANFGSGLEWKQLTSVLPTLDGGDFGPFALDETATKIRFRTGEHAEQAISAISVPRKKEMIVSETAIDENAERNVRWSKTISVSRSNIDVVDIQVESTDPNCPFQVSKTSIGTDCADRTTETFEVFFTPAIKDSVYTGTITITDGKAQPVTHTITMSVKTTGYNQSILGFDLPASCLTTEEVEMPEVTTNTGLEVIFLSSDSSIAYVENNKMVILSAGTVDIIAYQAGDDRYNEASLARTINIELTPVEILEAPVATEVAPGKALEMAILRGGQAEVEGSFDWLNPGQIMEENGDVEIIFTPAQDKIYATATTTVPVTVSEQPVTYSFYEAAICEGDSVEFAGKWYYQQTQEDVLLEEKNSYDTDSIVILTVNVLPVYIYPVEEKTVYVDEEVFWQDEFRATDEIGTFEIKAEYTTVNGCDSVYTLMLTVNERPTTYGEFEAETCDEPVEFKGVVYEETTVTDVLVGKNIIGGDSIVHVNIVINHATASETVKTIVYGTEETWNGYDLSEQSVGQHTLTFSTTNAAGCDSVATLKLMVTKDEVLIVDYPISFCEGDSAQYRGKWYYEAGADQIYAEGDVKDTVYVVNVTVLNHTASEEEMTIVYGDAETWHGYDLSELAVGQYILRDTTVNAVLCDSVITLTLTVNKLETLEVPVEISFCEGGSEIYRDTEYTEAGVFRVNAEGDIRDTVYVVNVTVLHPTASEEEKTIVYGDEEEWHGHDLSELAVGQYILRDTTVNAVLCDSVITLTLTVNKLETLEVPVELGFCTDGAVTYRDTEYSEEGEFRIEAEGAVRDTVYILNVVELLPTASEEEMTIVYGDEEEWHGNDLSGLAVGEYTFRDTTVNAAGCDSVITLTLTVEKEEALTVDYPIAFCEGDSALYRGTWYFEEGEEEIYATGATRDTIYVVNVTVLQPTASEEEMTIVYRDAETWHGHDLSELAVGQYIFRDTTFNAAGCDSVITLTLHVNKLETLEIPVELGFCEGGSETYRGEEFTEDGEYEILIEGEIQDTLYLVNVVLYEPTESEEEMTIAYGDKVEWNGEDLSVLSVGEHILTFTTANANGCDSVITLTLTVEKLETLKLGQDLVVCEGDSAEYLGKWYYEDGEESYFMEGEARDTVITVTVTVIKTTYEEIHMTDTVGHTLVLPEGEWFLGEQPVSEPYVLTEADMEGLEFVQYGKTDEGCETVVRLIVTVENPEGVEDVFVDGDKITKFFYNGVMYIRRGDALYNANGERVK